MKRRRTGKLNVIKTPRVKKQKAPELVSKCDHCGKPFGRTKAGMTYARTKNSAGVMAPSNGLHVAYRDERWLVCCSDECLRRIVSKPCAAIEAMS